MSLVSSSLSRAIAHGVSATSRNVPRQLLMLTTTSRRVIHSSQTQKTNTASSSTISFSADCQSTTPQPKLPSYLVDTYTWAYLTKDYMPVLDTNIVVSGILWGNANRLMKSAAQEFAPGMRVLQPACVYGTFSNMLAEQVGPAGHLTVSDVATVQLERLHSKVKDMKNVTLALADARHPVGGPYDGICCFFLLHEVPDDVKSDIVKSLFSVLKPGGKLVFVDYHKPAALHPLKMVMSVVFDVLEPFAKGLWTTEIQQLCPEPTKYEWSKETIFGGMYQKVIAQCRSAPQ